MKLGKILTLKVALVLLLAGCGQKKLDIGLWRGVIHTQGQQIPYNFELRHNIDDSYHVTVINGNERLEIDSVVVQGDSIHIPFLIFDSYIHAKFKKGKMTGHWIKPYAKDYRLPFVAEHGKDYRFFANAKSSFDFSGKWEVEFTDDKSSYKAVGIFEQEASFVTGSFLAPRGDYRFLQGSVNGDSLFLSLFDGSNLYLLKAKGIGPDRITGDFYSGMTVHRKWEGRRNENAELSTSNQDTFMKEGHDSLEFQFPDMQGNPVSISDERFEEKVVIVQIMGSWCANCMDETKFLAQWYIENQDKPVEIIGLAFERKNDFSYAKQQLSRHINRFDVRYPILFAGENNKENLSGALPMIEGLDIFPTTVFVDKNKQVRNIHAGFSGPGTGEFYEQFVREFNDFVDSLVSEPTSATSGP